MKDKSQSKRSRGGQPGNQNARTHGRYSAIISPRTLEVLKEVMALDHRGRQLICGQLLRGLVEDGEAGLLESHSFSPVPEKPERMPENPDSGIDLDAWAKEQNIDLDKFMAEVFKTIPGWTENE